MTNYGNSSACGPPCDVLLEHSKGVQWHMLAVQLAIAELRVPHVTRGNTPRKAAWEAVYGKGSWKPNAHQVLSRPEVRAACIYHTRPATEELVDFKRQLEEQLEHESLFDLTLLFDQRREIDPKALAEMVRMVLQGIRDEAAPGEDVEDFLGSGMLASYGKQRRPPTFEELVHRASFLIQLRLKPLSELQSLGYSSVISKLSHDRRGRWTVEIDRRHSRNLLSQIRQYIDYKVTMDVAEAHLIAAIKRLQEIMCDAFALIGKDRGDERACSIVFVKKWAEKLKDLSSADPGEAKRWRLLGETATGSPEEFELLVAAWGKGAGA